MKLIVLESGSKENGYILQASTGESLILEAGAHLDKLEKAMNFDFSAVVGCLISHRHMDHAQWLPKYLNAGITCYMNEDTSDALEGEYNNAWLMYSERQFTLGSFTIRPLEVAHDVPCYAFMIDHPESGRMFFLTDSSFCRWNLSKAGIKTWMVECNYHLEKLEANYKAGFIPHNVYERVLYGHFGLGNCLEFFTANDLSTTMRIFLLHLSNKNGDGPLFKQEIQRLTGKPVYIAKRGLTEFVGKDIF